jgi:cellulase
MHDPDDPQVYPYCFQANIQSSGNVVPTETVTFPDAYKLNPDFEHFNLYYGADFNSFKPPGPPVWDGAGSQGPSTPAPAPSSGSVDAPAAPTDAAPTAPAYSDAAAGSASTTLVTSGAHATGRCKRR